MVGRADADHSRPSQYRSCVPSAVGYKSGHAAIHVRAATKTAIGLIRATLTPVSNAVTRILMWATMVLLTPREGVLGLAPAAG